MIVVFGLNDWIMLAMIVFELVVGAMTIGYVTNNGGLGAGILLVACGIIGAGTLRE